MTDPYFGYQSGQNEQLRALRMQGRHLGEDVMHYPRMESGTYIEPTINWDKPLSGDRAKRSNALFANDSIEYIRKRINAQSAEGVEQLADRWARVARVLADLRQRVYDPALSLKEGGKSGEGWTGDGADAFLARGPGATLKSIDDWREAAIANRNGASRLAAVIREYQRQIETLWREYETKMVQYSNQYMEMNFLEGKNTDIKTLPQSTQDQYVSFLKGHEIDFSRRAQKIQYDMAQGYWSVLSGEMAGGTATLYEGPKNAVQADPKFLMPKFGDMPSIMSTPNVSPPQIGTPNADVPNTMMTGPAPNLTAPTVTTPTGLGPQLTAPQVAPQLNASAMTPPGVPSVSAVPSVAPVLPPGLVKGPMTTVAPAVRAPSNLTNANNLMNNLPGQSKTPGVLRGTGAPSGQSPSMPSLPRGGQPPGAQIKGPGSNANNPPGMPGRSAPGQGVPGKGAPGMSPGAPRGTGQPNQFGAPSGNPTSPVLRSPRTEPPPQLPGRGAPSTQGRAGRPGATSPVLGRPRGTAPVEMPQAKAAPPPGNSALSPPRAQTSQPVVGRTPPAAPGDRSAAESSAGVLRSGRQSGTPAYEGEIGSRKWEEADQQLTVEQEFDKIRQLLRQEDAWTVTTPGGGVLDSAPARPVTPATEPKPTVGA